MAAAAPQEVAKPIERAAKEAVKDVKAAVKGGPQAPTPKSASKDLKSAVKEAPKVLDKVRYTAARHSCKCTHTSVKRARLCHSQSRST